MDTGQWNIGCNWDLNRENLTKFDSTQKKNTGRKKFGVARWSKKKQNKKRVASLGKRQVRDQKD